MSLSTKTGGEGNIIICGKRRALVTKKPRRLISAKPRTFVLDKKNNSTESQSRSRATEAAGKNKTTVEKYFP